MSPDVLAPPKSRARSEPSGVFSLFQPPQIQQFREAFQLIDHDRDGWVTQPDLREIFASLGISPDNHLLDSLLSSRPGANTHDTHPSDRGINFTMFLTMMGERLFHFDPEPDLKEAFECFDEADSGFVNVDEMRKWMSEVGERMDHHQARLIPHRQGNFNYREWIKVLRVNDKGEDPEQPS
ncbi:EF-hand [Phlebopus sp. FC_14]|nr:EF-hand [Phlebopus sp. FC_14]